MDKPEPKSGMVPLRTTNHHFLTATVITVMLLSSVVLSPHHLRHYQCRIGQTAGSPKYAYDTSICISESSTQYNTNITGSNPFRVGGRGVEPIASSVLLEPQQRQQVIQLLEAHVISERHRQNETESLLASISQDTTLRASVAAGAAHSSMPLFQQQLQQQQQFRYLEELAAVLTIQQVRENPGILGSLSSALATAPAHHRTPPQPQPALNPLAGISQAPLLLRAQTQQQPQQDLAQSNALQALLSRETLPPR